MKRALRWNGTDLLSFTHMRLIYEKKEKKEKKNAVSYNFGMFIKDYLLTVHVLFLLVNN